MYAGDISVFVKAKTFATKIEVAESLPRVIDWHYDMQLQ